MSELLKEALRREIDLYSPIIHLFSEKKYVFIEVPYFRKRVDIVFASSSLKNLYAVETKIFDWRSAVKQATMNQLFAQLSYVALPDWRIGKLNRNIFEIFRRYQVGLISVRKDAEIVIPARRNGYFNRKHYRLIKYVLKNSITHHKPRSIGDIIHASKKESRMFKFLQTWSD